MTCDTDKYRTGQCKIVCGEVGVLLLDCGLKEEPKEKS